MNDYAIRSSGVDSKFLVQRENKLLAKAEPAWLEGSRTFLEIDQCMTPNCPDTATFGGHCKAHFDVLKNRR